MPFLAEIRLFAGNFAPRAWMLCEGQILPINQNQALFSLLGTIYGGDGRTTFALPDLRGRVAISPGTGPGLPTYRLGQRGGNYQHRLTVQEMPSHNHNAITAVPVTTEDATSDEPGVAAGNTGLLSTTNGALIYGGAPENPISKYSGNDLGVTVGLTGGGQAFDMMQPYLGINFIICVQGTFPSRN